MDLKLIVSSIFKHLLAICIFPFDTVCQFLFPYTDWMICLMVSIFCNPINSLYFNSLSDMHVALFRLVMVSSVVQGLWDVMHSDLSITDSFLWYGSPFHQVLASADILKCFFLRVLGSYIKIFDPF